MTRIATKLLAAIFSISLAAADDLRQQVAIVDNPAADYLAICGWEFDVEGGGYSTCKIDLNGDGLEDHMFANRATSGTGGQAATVYLNRTDGKFTRVGTLGHGAISTETLRTGGRLLHCSWNFGGGHSAITTYIISHQGLMEIMNIHGEGKDKEYKTLFDKVFQQTLKPRYTFVAARPKPTAKSGRQKSLTPASPSTGHKEP